MYNYIRNTSELLSKDYKLNQTLLAPTVAISTFKTPSELIDQSFSSTATNCHNYNLPCSCFMDSSTSMPMFNNGNMLFVLKQSCILTALYTVRTLLSANIFCESPTLLQLGKERIRLSQLLSPDSQINILGHLADDIPSLFRAAASSKLGILSGNDYSFCKSQEISFTNHIKELRKGFIVAKYPHGAAYLNELIDWKSEIQHLIPIQKSDYFYYLIQNSTTLSKTIEQLFSSNNSNKNKTFKHLSNISKCLEKFIPTFYPDMSPNTFVDDLMLSLQIEKDFPLALINQIILETAAHSEVNLQRLQPIWKQLIAFPDPYSRNFFLSAAFEVLNTDHLNHISDKYFRGIGSAKSEESIVYIPQSRFDKPSPLDAWHSILEYFFYYVSDITLPVFSTNFFITLFKSICKQVSQDFDSICHNEYRNEQVLVLSSMHNILKDYVEKNPGYFLWNSMWNPKNEEQKADEVQIADEEQIANEEQIADEEQIASKACHFSKNSYNQSFVSVEEAPQNYLIFEKNYARSFPSKEPVHLFDISLRPKLFSNASPLTDSIYNLLKELFENSPKMQSKFDLLEDTSSFNGYSIYQKNISDQNILFALNSVINQ